MAIRDELTRPFNRRHMLDLIALQRSHHERHALPLAVSLLDLDHFKRINDGLGHAAGDEVLRRFAATAAQQLRGGDLLSRWGGEEFLVLFPATRSVDACAALQRLRDALAEQDFSDLSPQLRVTFSAGVTLIEPSETDAAAIERADRALYRAKGGGRNCTVVQGFGTAAPREQALAGQSASTLRTGGRRGLRSTRRGRAAAHRSVAPGPARR